MVVDFTATIDGELIEGGEGRAQLVELGAGRLIPGFEEGLIGAGAGEQRTLELRFPTTTPRARWPGRDAVFEVTVAEVRAKVLPELDDDFARRGRPGLARGASASTSAQGWRSTAPVRPSFATRHGGRGRGRRDHAARVAGRSAAREAFERSMHTLSHRGVSREAYLQIAGASEEELIAGARPSAERALRAEAVIAAIVAAEAIEPTDEELPPALEQRPPDESGRAPDPKKLLTALRRSGRLEELRADVAADQALERLVEAAVAITPERAAAREKLWTPGS